MPTKKRPALLFLQFAWPVAALVLIMQSAALAWWGTVSACSAWASALPILSGLVLAMGGAAAGGPLVSDKIKATAPKEVP